MKDAGYCDGTYETLSLCAFIGLFEKIRWRHYDVLMTLLKLKIRITREQCKIQAIVMVHMKTCNFVRLFAWSKIKCDVIMKSLWR